MLHWDDLEPDGSIRHTAMSEEDAIYRYRETYDMLAELRGRRKLTDEELIEDILINHWGYCD